MPPYPFRKTGLLQLASGFDHGFQAFPGGVGVDRIDGMQDEAVRRAQRPDRTNGALPDLGGRGVEGQGAEDANQGDLAPQALFRGSHLATILGGWPRRADPR